MICMNRTDKVELLAPCGSYDCVRAAVSAGADAVYLSGTSFGARAYAKNFSDEELIDTIGFAHLYGVKVYLTVNTLMKNKEIDSLFSYILPLYEAGLDAVIVQDIGVFDYLHKNFPDLDIHISTQVSTSGRYGASFFKEHGAKRIVTARELSLDEIKDIHDNVDIEIESFVHGALCYCYSGQCLLSSFIGGRSGNRGRCAQACRLLYLKEGKKDYLLSLKDMCTLSILPEILDAGVYSLKIEGRMKNAEYVAGVVSIYRKYVDMYLEDRVHYHVDDEDVIKLMDLFNRGGFCEGYYKDNYPKDMLTHKKPNHEGVAVATCVNRLKNEITVKAFLPINKGDVVEYGDKYDHTFSESKKKGDIIKLKVTRECRCKAGDKIYRIRNNSLYEELDKDYISAVKKLDISFKLKAIVGEVLELTADCLGYSVVISGDTVERAESAPVSASRVETQLSKLGDTPYKLVSCDIDISEDAFISMGVLNSLRRSVITLLEEKMKNSMNRESVEQRYVMRRNASDSAALADMGQVRYSVLFENGTDYMASLSETLVTRIYLEDPTISDDSLAKLRETKEVYYAFPVVFRKSFMDSLGEKDLSRFDGFLIRSMEEYAYIKASESLKDKAVICDATIPCFNDYTKLFLRSLGLSTTASYELCREELLDKIMDDEMVVYGHIPMMVSARPIGEAISGDITDRKNETYHYVNDFAHNQNRIYSARPLYVRESGFLRQRIVMTAHETMSLRMILDCLQTGKSTDRACTYGHYIKGVM